MSWMSRHRAIDGDQPLKVIDLFAGCGGLSLGFRESERFIPVAAVENDLDAASTYALNFGEDHVYWGDIADWVEGDVPAADIVIGGPPCQGFSNLGAKREDDERNDLWEKYLATLVKVKPKAFLMENVDRFLRTEQFKTFYRLFRGDGPLRDYSIDFGVLQAADHGSAQLRKRAIVIGTHRDFDQILLPVQQTAREVWRTVKDAFIGILSEVDPEKIDLPADRTVELFERTVLGSYTAEEIHVTRRYEEMSIDRFRNIPRGGNRFDLPDELKAPCWVKHTRGSTDVMGRLVWDKPSVTVRTEFFKPEKGRYLHPDENRALTHHEAARLQGFPDTFVWCGSKLSIARQIGNAVPIELAKFVAQHVAEGLASA